MSYTRGGNTCRGPTVVERFGWMEAKGGMRPTVLWGVQVLTTCSLPFNGFKFYEHVLRTNYYCNRSYNRPMKETMRH